MPRIRVSTTIDEALLVEARRVRRGVADSALLDEALRSLLASPRAAGVDSSYGAYEEHPLDEPDDWGNLASFRSAAGAT